MNPISEYSTPNPKTSPQCPPGQRPARHSSRRHTKRDQLDPHHSIAWCDPQPRAVPPKRAAVLVLLFSIPLLPFGSIPPPAAAAETKEDSAAACQQYLNEEAPLATSTSPADTHQRDTRIFRILKTNRHQRLEIHIFRRLRSRGSTPPDPELDRPNDTAPHRTARDGPRRDRRSPFVLLRHRRAARLANQLQRDPSAAPAQTRAPRPPPGPGPAPRRRIRALKR